MGRDVGRLVGREVGIEVGRLELGLLEGTAEVGFLVVGKRVLGTTVGVRVGIMEGETVGFRVGILVGALVGVLLKKNCDIKSELVQSTYEGVLAEKAVANSNDKRRNFKAKFIINNKLY